MHALGPGQSQICCVFLGEAMNRSWKMKIAKAFALAAILVSLPSLAFAQSTAPGGVVIVPSPYYGYSASPYYGYYNYAPAHQGYYAYAPAYQGYYAYAPGYRGYYNYVPGYYYGWQRW
jgi:hypothetical protein